jgi:hypothetical protein
MRYDPICDRAKIEEWSRLVLTRGCLVSTRIVPESREKSKSAIETLSWFSGTLQLSQRRHQVGGK